MPRKVKGWPELRQPLFVGAVLLYGAYKLIRHVLHWPLPPLVTGYLADLMALPIMLTVALAAQRRLGNPAATWVLPDTWIVATWAYLTFVFEAVVPYYSSNAVADPLDGLAYAAGAWAFRRWLNRPLPPAD